MGEISGSTIEKIRIVLSDVPNTDHAISIFEAMKHGYNYLSNKEKYPDVDISKNIAIIPGTYRDAKEYTEKDKNVEMIVRSYTGVKWCVEDAKTLYPRVQTFMPLGSNNYIELNWFSDPNPPIIVICGAGDNEGRNNTAYGNGLEFWDGDWSYSDPGQDISSYANGWIAGKFLRFKDEIRKIYDSKQLEYTEDELWWHTRYICRYMARRNEPNRPKGEDGNPVMWHKENGYGYISPDWVAVYLENHMNREIPEDPYIKETLLGEIGELTATSHGIVRLILEKVNNAETYVINKNGNMLTKLSGASLNLTYEDVLSDYGQYIYEYYAFGKDGQTLMSNKIVVKYINGMQPKIVPYEEETNKTDV